MNARFLDHWRCKFFTLLQFYRLLAYLWRIYNEKDSYFFRQCYIFLNVSMDNTMPAFCRSLLNPFCTIFHSDNRWDIVFLFFSQNKLNWIEPKINPQKKCDLNVSFVIQESYKKIFTNVLRFFISFRIAHISLSKLIYYSLRQCSRQ